MFTRRLLTYGMVAGFLVVPCLQLISGADPTPAGPGKKVSSFSLTDPRDQKRVALADLKDKKAVVVVFVGTECPVNNAYLPRLAQFHKEYADRGVQFLAVNANRQDAAERVAEHAKKAEVPFPVLKDADAKVADLFGAQRTPEAFVLDAHGTVRYQGRIDDQYGIGYARPKPTRRDLAEALEEVLAGKAVTTAAAPVSGCLIGRAPTPKAETTVTYGKDISRLVQKHCQECHRPNHIGPMALMSYDDVAAWSGTIKEMVSFGRMPPWHADPRFGKFRNDRSMPKEDREALLAWIDQGCPKGDDKDLPPPRQFVEGWRIGKPDVVFSMAEEFDVPAETPKGGIPYKYFQVETNFKEDRWIERAEAKPGAAEVVHHIILFIVPPGEKFNAVNPNLRVLCGTAPGDMPMILQPGTARKIPAGSRIVFQMHYTPNGKAMKDRSSAGLIFAKDPPKRQALTRGVSNPRFLIPAGDDNYKVESRFEFPEDGHIISFMPHMHVRGKDFLYEAIYPDGTTETLLSVPRFDFNWQSVYRFAEPKAIPKGTVIHCVAHFDNSVKNLNNPDPTKAVRWGDQTWEEMMIGWTDFTFNRPPQ